MLVSNYETETVRPAGFFLGQSPSDRDDTLLYGYAEEVEELFLDSPHPRELLASLQGRRTPSAVVADKAIGEFGDQTYYLAAQNIVAETGFSRVALETIRIFGGETSISPERIQFRDIDLACEGALGPISSKQLDYFSLYHADVPLLDTLPSVRADMHDAAPAAPSKFLSGDGVYTILRSAATTLEAFNRQRMTKPNTVARKGATEALLTSSAIALGALSSLAQARLGSSLSEAAQVNTAKLAQRIKDNTLEFSGTADPTRAIGKSRPRLSSFEPILFSIMDTLRAEAD